MKGKNAYVRWNCIEGKKKEQCMKLKKEYRENSEAQKDIRNKQRRNVKRNRKKTLDKEKKDEEKKMKAMNL